MRKFDFYEFTGVVLPGVVLLVGAALILPGGREVLDPAAISSGGLGLLLVFGYVAGQLVQALGNGLERAFWSLEGGMPTDWTRSGPERLLASRQIEQLGRKLAVLLGTAEPVDPRSVPKKEWPAVVRQVYAAVAGARRNARVDVFNGNYGLHRGLAASFLVLFFLEAFLVVIQKLDGSFSPAGHARDGAILLLLLAAAALYRMRRFGIHYGRELLVQFLALEKDEPMGTQEASNE